MTHRELSMSPYEDSKQLTDNTVVMFHPAFMAAMERMAA